MGNKKKTTRKVRTVKAKAQPQITADEMIVRTSQEIDRFYHLSNNLHTLRKEVEATMTFLSGLPIAYGEEVVGTVRYLKGVSEGLAIATSAINSMLTGDGR